MSCFGGRDERLYLLELTVGRLCLTDEKLKEIRDGHLVVKIKFIDFPVFEVSRNDFSSARPTPRNSADGSLDYYAGKSCLFTMQPRDLVRGMQSDPLRIGVFCHGDTFPIAEAEVPVSGCLCDQVAMAMNDTDNLPKPFTLNGGFHLSDPGGNPSGNISLDLRLTCFGKSITTHYRLRPNSFLFKNDKEKGEFCVKRVVPPPVCGDRKINITIDGREVQMGKCGDSMLPDAFSDERLSSPPPTTEEIEDEKKPKETIKIKKEKKPRGKGKKNKGQ
ncbi:uncharacterized protein LOC105687660 [Athalia rosae]|uniref:uncharacterized protein LOC105687660 n=1 Tax=Athalia rosae TaxID=37344 RepID=UPI00203441C2|nr:uncharacterized protein LOC105687660 [Athalia rosae]